MTGKKEELLERLALLASEVYEREEDDLDAFFKANRFVRVPGSCHSGDGDFDLSLDTPLKNLLLRMYALKHLRGNAILEAGHVNNSFDPLEAARALLGRDVNLDGMFLRIERG